MEIREYKCPACGGAVSFDSSSQKLKCPYCGTEFEVDALDEYEKERALKREDDFGWEQSVSVSRSSSIDGAALAADVKVNAGRELMSESDLGDLSTGSCPSCGAELVGDRNTIALVCPCCGNAQIVEKRIEGLLRPEYIIPFQLEKKAAVAALKKFYERKRLLPDLFKEENRVNSIQGLYVPFWLFDARSRGRILYRATKKTFWSDVNYYYTKTDFYSVLREGEVSFEKIPVDGSEKMDDAYMDAIEPFDYGGMKEFLPAFLAGFSAEKYDIDAEASKGRAGRRIKNTVEAEFAESVRGYSSVTAENSSVAVESGTIRYTLFPVWILNTKYKGENYRFIMNGQSGRLVGRLPSDRGKFIRYWFMFTALFGTAFTAIIQLLRLVI